MKLRLEAIALLVFAICIASGSHAALAQEALQIAIPTVSAPPKLDGTLNDGAWQQAAKVQLTHDRLTHGPAAETTTAYLLTDRHAIYVAFDARQTRTPVVANQRNNNTGVDTDDEVKIALWPGGKNGIAYTFVSTPLGTRYQTSTENLTYEPSWYAFGKPQGNGYIVTMRIPLSIMRGANQNQWLINLTRWEVTTGSLYSWSGGPSFGGTGDQNYAMPLLSMPRAVSVRPQPRFGVYGLGTVASRTIGGSTSRMGIDMAIPINDTTSFIAALHPDFSNAESDQQTIAPTAFRRFFNETRPFFTQGAQYYNFYECDACNAEASLYTPAIPTPRDGYAIEGKQGALTFAGFDAVGFGRTDAAQSLIFRTPSQHFYVSAQHVGVNGTGITLPGPSFRDDTWQFATKLDDLKHKFVYANYGTESATGNWITDRSQAQFREVGAGYYGPNYFFGGGIRHIGAQYNPFDGFFTHAFDANFNSTAMDGYGLFGQRTLIPAGGSIQQWNFNVYGDSYHNPAGLSQMDLNIQVDVLTRKQWEVTQNFGSSYFMIGGQVVPVTQESTRLTYKPSSATPMALIFLRGRYGSGYLYSWFRSATVKIGQRGALSLEADDTRQYLDNGTLNHQWFQRVSYAYQIDADSSFAVGVRRFFGPPPEPNGGATCALGYCPNISFAYHKRSPHDEWYVIYGGASRIVTLPQLLVKWIHYVGSEKGT